MVQRPGKCRCKTVFTNAVKVLLPMETRATAEYAVQSEIPAARRQEILRYLQLFGYKPEITIVQVHVAGFFNRKGAARAAARGPQLQKGTLGLRSRWWAGRTTLPF